jgi:hypothetical protein
VEQLGVEVLQERTVTVHFQIVRVVPATKEDDPDLKNDWRARGLVRHSLAAPGRLVLPIDPVLSTRIIGEPYYLFESSVLRVFGARLLDMVTLPLNKLIPKFVPTDGFPYREALGTWHSIHNYNVLTVLRSRLFCLRRRRCVRTSS